MRLRERFARWLCPNLHATTLRAHFKDGYCKGLSDPRREVRYVDTPRVVTYGVLDKAVLAEVTRRCNANTVVNNTSTELTVAYQLGIAHVLNVLAKDFTIETQ